jgi:hypothetical protein
MRDRIPEKRLDDMEGGRLPLAIVNMQDGEQDCIKSCMTLRGHSAAKWRVVGNGSSLIIHVPAQTDTNPAGCIEFAALNACTWAGSISNGYDSGVRNEVNAIRKSKNGGYMQALIHFDGWRKWKDFADSNGLKNASSAPGDPGPNGKHNSYTMIAFVAN